MSSPWAGYVVVAEMIASPLMKEKKTGKPRFVPGTPLEVRFGYFEGVNEETRAEAVALLRSVKRRCLAGDLLQNPRLVKVRHPPTTKAIHKTKIQLKRT